MGKITLTEEKETLLIPLYSKATESRKPAPVLMDRKAVEIVDSIDYDFGSLKIPSKSAIGLCIRAKLIDTVVRDFLANHDDTVVLHLGCGLDSRCSRIGSLGADWYDLDFPDVVDIRRLFFAEADKYHLISSSVTDLAWLARVPRGRSHYLIVAEGLFMYLKEDDIKALLKAIKDRVGSYTIAFDAFDTFTAKRINRHPSIRKTGAVIQWGIDDPETVAGWVSGMKLEREVAFTSAEAIAGLSTGIRLAYKFFGLFPMMRRSHRLLIYSVRD